RATRASAASLHAWSARILIATLRSSPSCSASHTTPIAPSPITRRRRYRSPTTSPGLCPEFTVGGGLSQSRARCRRFSSMFTGLAPSTVACGAGALQPSCRRRLCSPPHAEPMERRRSPAGLTGAARLLVEAARPGAFARPPRRRQHEREARAARLLRRPGGGARRQGQRLGSGVDRAGRL